MMSVAPAVLARSVVPSQQKHDGSLRPDGDGMAPE